MQLPLDTRLSLIVRLPDSADAEAWREFVEIYHPLLFRLARSKGMQQADAEDFVQEVSAAVARSIERWVDRADRGTFRAWLFRIASNLAVNFLTRRKYRRIGSGDSDVQRLLDEQCDRESAESQAFRLEYRREIFRWAAEKARQAVSETVWIAFWRTTIDEDPISAVAEDLGVSIGSVYVARSRVTKRITETIQRHEEQCK